MKNIKSNFRKEKDKNINLSDLVNFASAIKCKKLTKKSVLENFHKLVDREDYQYLDGKGKKELNDWLCSLLKHTEDG